MVLVKDPRTSIHVMEHDRIRVVGIFSAEQSCPGFDSANMTCPGMLATSGSFRILILARLVKMWERELEGVTFESSTS